MDEREMLIEAEPQIYFLTEHYRGWPYLLVRYPKMDERALAALLERVWRSIAPKRLAAERSPRSSLEN